MADTKTSNLALGTICDTYYGLQSNVSKRFYGTSIYNVKDWGAVGDTSTDDTTALQNVINQACSTGGTIYFPLGQYKVTQRLTPPSGMASAKGVRLVGSLGPGNNVGSRIFGNFADYIISTGYPDPDVFASSPTQGIELIENLGIINFHATLGCGVIVGGGSGTTIRDCFVSANLVGVKGGDSAFVLEVATCNVSGSGSSVSGAPPVTGSVGVYGAAMTRNCRIAGYDYCARTLPTQSICNIIGNSIETSNYAIYFNGVAGAILGNQMESNLTGIYISGSGCLCSGNYIHSPAGNGVYGIRLIGGSGNCVSGNIVSLSNPSGLVYGIDCSSVDGQNNAVIGNRSTVSGSGSNWGIPTDYTVNNSDVTFIGNNNPYLGVLFAKLPVAANSQGAGNSVVIGTTYECSDCPSTALGANVTTGGSSNKYLLRWNGSNWVRMA